MRVLVCGGRDYADVEQFVSVVKPLKEQYTWPYDPCGRSARCYMEIVSGMAPGADSLAARFARAYHLKLHEFPADWTLGRKAGPIRNQRMIDEGKPDLVVAFPGGRGTADMVSRARKAGIRVVEVANA